MTIRIFILALKKMTENELAILLQQVCDQRLQSSETETEANIENISTTDKLTYIDESCCRQTRSYFEVFLLEDHTYQILGKHQELRDNPTIQYFQQHCADIVEVVEYLGTRGCSKHPNQCCQLLLELKLCDKLPPAKVLKNGTVELPRLSLCKDESVVVEALRKWIETNDYDSSALLSLCFFFLRVYFCLFFEYFVCKIYKLLHSTIGQNIALTVEASKLNRIRERNDMSHS